MVQRDRPVIAELIGQACPRARHVALDGGDHGGLAPAGTGSRGSAAGRTARPAVPASASVASTARRRGAALVAGPGRRVRTSPGEGGAEERDGERQHRGAADRRPALVGAVAWLIASLPHGKPPHGQRSLNASSATHQPATASGQPGKLSSRRWAIAEHREDDRRGDGERDPGEPGDVDAPTPATGRRRRCRRPARRRTRRAATGRTARSRAAPGPAAASGQTPAGGNAAASTRPPASPVASAQRNRSGGARLARGCRCGACAGVGLSWDHLRRVTGMPTRCEVVSLAQLRPLGACPGR